MALWPVVWNILRSPSAKLPARPDLSVSPGNLSSVGGMSNDVASTTTVDTLNAQRWQLPVLYLQGSDYEIGLQHGRLLKTEIQALVDNFFAEFAQGAGKLFYTYIAPSRLYHLYNSIPERYQAELQGVADGSDLPLASILLINFFDDILNLLELGWAYACSTVAARGRDGVLMGRNLDYNGNVGDLVRNYQAIVVRQPRDAATTVSVTVAGQVGILTGMNQFGLSLGSMTSQSTEQDWNGLGCSFLYRIMLDLSSSVADAIATFQETVPAQGNNLMLADATSGARLEFTSARHAITHLAQQPLGMSNHFLDPELAATHTGLYHKTTAPGSQSRYSRLCIWKERARAADIDRMDASHIIEAMTDGEIEANYPLGDRDPWRTSGVVNNQGTLHSVVFDPQQRSMHVAIGMGEAAIATSDFVTFDPFAALSVSPAA